MNSHTPPVRALESAIEACLQMYHSQRGSPVFRKECLDVADWLKGIVREKTRKPCPKCSTPDGMIPVCVGSKDEDGVVPPQPMPQIVIVIDEFADLMLTAPADVETSLMALAQKSRAVGIHIILATQRPSVNVITGVIKANFPSRIAFQVATKTDSRTILDMNGAERLLGRGDMLFLPGGQGEPVRVHGAYVSGEETEALVEALKAADYHVEEVAVFGGHVDISAAQRDQDELFDEAMRIVVENQQASTSFLQRRMKVGYSRAARLMDELENAGIVGPAEGAKPRQILVSDDPLADDEEEL